MKAELTVRGAQPSALGAYCEVKFPTDCELFKMPDATAPMAMSALASIAAATGAGRFVRYGPISDVERLLRNERGHPIVRRPQTNLEENQSAVMVHRL